MSIGAVSPDLNNAVMSNTNSVPQPVVSESPAFSDTFRARTSLSSGSADLDAIFDEAGLRFRLPPNLLKAVAKAESNFRPSVTSRSGAMGIMQLMPGTARYLGVTDPFDPQQNIMGGAKYLREMLDRFGGDISLALAAYNAGPGAVDRYGGIPPFQETQNYVPKVLEFFGGGDITAGVAAFGSMNAPGKSGGASMAGFGEALTQMFFVKMIEMQMNSSNKDKKGLF